MLHCSIPAGFDTISARTRVDGTMSGSYWGDILSAQGLDGNQVRIEFFQAIQQWRQYRWIICVLDIVLVACPEDKYLTRR